MSKRDYEAIARCIGEATIKQEGLYLDGKVLIDKLSSYLHSCKPRFDDYKFKLACVIAIELAKARADRKESNE